MLAAAQQHITKTLAFLVHSGFELRVRVNLRYDHLRRPRAVRPRGPRRKLADLFELLRDFLRFCHADQGAAAHAIQRIGL